MEFVKIYNRNNFLLSEIPIINPFSRRYNIWWKLNKKRCIEGLWSIDDKNTKIDLVDEKLIFPKSDKWRYIPPTVYFYVNFGNILRNKKGATSGAKQLMRPNLDDIEWEFGYNLIEARGFSGFEFDDVYSCNKFLLEDITDEVLVNRCLDEKGEVIPILYNNFFKKDGTRKKYQPVKIYIRQIFTNPLGRPIYGNLPKNMMLLSSRDGGKSYLVGNQGIAHELLFDGLRYYDNEVLKENLPIAEIVVGAAISDKSRDLLNKVKYTLDNLPGAWKKGTSHEIPCPFFKHMGGSILPNKDWRNEYQIKRGGDWKKFVGSFIKHRVFTTENPEAAAGGRPGTIILEEVGLISNLLTIQGSNDAAQNDGGEKFGSSLYIGTAGNMEKILEPETIFNEPFAYDFLEFDDTWENTGKKICWFVPATHMSRKFKDKNGNTKIGEATKFFLERRKKKKKGVSSKALDSEMMNYPLIPSEMFLNKTNNKFPISDIKIRIRDLSSPNNNELKYSLKGLYGINSDGKVVFEQDKNDKPIYDYPLNKSNTTSMDGCIQIFEPPIKNENNEVPNGIYIAGLDPINEDGNDDIHRSLQSFYLMNLLTDRIVVEYTGRTKFAKTYYEQVRRILIDYNATLLYENQKKGIYIYFDQKNCLYLLEDTPIALRDIEAQRGSFTGNKSKGVYATPKINFWGQQELLPNYLESKAYNTEGDITNLQIFKSIAGLKEMIYYNGNKVNTDRISSLGMLMIARELKLKIKVNLKKKKKRIVNDSFFNRFNSRNSNTMTNQMRFND